MFQGLCDKLEALGLPPLAEASASSDGAAYTVPLSWRPVCSALVEAVRWSFRAYDAMTGLNQSRTPPLSLSSLLPVCTGHR